MSGEATNEICIIFTLRVKSKHIQQKSFEFSFYYTQSFQQRGTFHYIQAISFLALFLDRDNEQNRQNA